jgi:hypothetical protein
VLGLTLVADFSLINTRTYEITSAFTAMGEGQDTKLVNSRDVRVSLNRPRVVREVSKALGEDVARQLAEQLGGGIKTPANRRCATTCHGMKRRRFCAEPQSCGQPKTNVGASALPHIDPVSSIRPLRDAGWPGNLQPP